MEQLTPDHFDIIVIDEFHHATAATYRRVIDHFEPKQLLGLTATPERMDGLNVQDEFFDGRIAAEMRLWEALENDLLRPFHYFGIPDGTDLTNLGWSKGTYTDNELGNLYTGNHARARIVVKQIRDKVSNPGAMRALGFCVTKSHAHFMADFFREVGFQAVALDSDSPASVRAQALADLRDGKLQVIFSVDLFNEGLDIPDVDTLLLLRPTNSATIFLQQLGRGLRRTETKPVLTVLDFIGQHRAEFRFEEQFRALTNLSRNRLVDHIEHDFPQLPSGCQIILEGKSKDLVLDNIRTQLGATIKTLVNEVKAYDTQQLADYLRESRREIKELYKSDNSWTTVLRRAGVLKNSAPSGEDALLKRVHAFLHVDDPDRAKAYLRLLADDAPSYETLSPTDQAYARMLFFNLWDNAGGFDELPAGPRVATQPTGVPRRTPPGAVARHGTGRPLPHHPAGQPPPYPPEGAQLVQPLRDPGRSRRSPLRWPDAPVLRSKVSSGSKRSRRMPSSSPWRRMRRTSPPRFVTRTTP